MNYPNINNNENPIKEVNYINEVEIVKRQSFKPRKEDFNYLDINFVNKEYMEIVESMANFLEELQNEIKKHYEGTNIKVGFYDFEVNSFSILLGINPNDLNYEEIEFLDEKFEKKFNTNKTMEIKVEFMEGEKILDKEFGINEQYYLVFTGDQNEKEDFYDQVFNLKNLAKILLLTTN